VQLEHPELYKNATKEQAQEFFKRFTRDSSSILKMAGDLEIAKEAVKACREWLRSKKLEYNLTTIARNIGKFIDETIRKYQLPPETDLTLLDEYKKLYKELKDQDISQIEIVKAIKQKMKETGKNINEILEEAVRKLKQKISSEIANSEIGDVIRKVAEKVSINQEVK
jgi:GTPase SAR1 family protein